MEEVATINGLENYPRFLSEITDQIRKAQYESLKAVNKEMISLYWNIGKSISEKQNDGWGKSVVETLSKDIQKEFPGITGFSSRNIWNMVRFYAEYQSDENLQPLVAEISWAKHVVIMTKCKNSQERQFYILATKKFGWTKDLLVNKIELKTFEKYLLGQTNFDATLPDKIKKQAALALKDDYYLGYTELADEHSERELELEIVKNIRAFLLDFGPDFSFIGNQYKIEVDGNEYFIDLLLYHRRLQSLIAIELKIGEFKPEYKGKMEFYLNVLNDTVKLQNENPSIGIIICKSKSRTTVDYALRSSNMPIGVATYSLTSELPEDFKALLPEAQTITDRLKLFFEKDEDN